MSAPKSDYTKMLKKASKMQLGYEERIAAQVKIIDRLVAAVTHYGDGLTDIMNANVIDNEEGDIGFPQRRAQEALANGQATLAVPTEEKS